MQEELQQRLRFLALGPEDIELLEAIRPVLEERADEFVDAFYRHLLAFPPLMRLLRDDAVRGRLLQQQRRYLLSLAGPKIDDNYVRQRREIGHVHERIGLEPRWYLGAYALYFSLLAPVIYEQFHDDRSSGERAIVALQKVLLLDAQLAMESYIEHHEGELTTLNDELAGAQRRLTLDLERRRTELRETTRRAHAAEELADVATLVAGLAHEIGTPMGVIQGHAKLLESAVEGDEATWRLQTIREQIDRISGIIQTLLNMARPGQRAAVPLSLQSLIESTLAFVTEKLNRRGIAAECSFERAPAIHGDPERLQQVLLNLMLNAADAMPDGGKLQISLCLEDDEWAVIRVADSGAGIRPEDLPRIFEPFFSTKPAGKGSGLGLAVARGIVSDHRGDIGVDSAPGEGTTFELRLPLNTASEGD